MRLPGALGTRRLMSFLVIVTRVGGDAGAATAGAPSDVAPRNLVYPTPTDYTPTKVQLVLGLGIPIETDVSTIMGYVMKYNYNLPYNASYLTKPYVRLERSTAEEDITSDPLPRVPGKGRPRSGSQVSRADGTFGRYAIYKMVEAAIDSTFQSGKACLLRAICELAVTPLNFDSGVIAQLIHVFLTPSCTVENYGELIDQEYLAAEFMGHRYREVNKCIRAFSECDNNFLDYFSKIH